MKTIFKILFLACVVFAFGILLYSPVCAGFKQSLYGIVLDAETGQPLEDVNVYIANSMLGAATDEKGRFVLLDVPLGTYELIVQMLGYEVQKARIRLTGPREEIYVFRLTPQIIPMPEVLVSARDQEQWRHNLEKFKELFIGTTRNASQCKLLNPYVLDFSITDEGIFKAVANQPLLIKNGALGYKLHIVLENFAYRPPKTGNYFVDYPVGGSGVKQIKERPSLLRYAGFPRFEALPPEYPGQEKVWKKNRQRAYRGSLRHFLRTLCRYYDRAVKSDTVEYPLYEGEFSYRGFRVYLTQNPWANKVIRNAPMADVMNLFHSGELPTERKMCFPGYLDVTYLNEMEEKRYRLDKNEMRGIRKQRSLITLNVDTLLVDTTGHFYNPYGVRTYGYWSWEKMAERLPFDYIPNDSELKPN